MDQTNILVVDDNEDIREVLRILLSSEGYNIEEAENGIAAIEKITVETDLVILDVMLPDMSGLKVCEKIRRQYNVPILFLSAKSQDSDKSLGLLIGGDDYLVKPFSHSELTARVKSLLRRYQIYKGKELPIGTTCYQYGNLIVNKQLNEVMMIQPDGTKKDISLTELEYQILKLLISNPRHVYPAQLIYETIWKEPYYYSSNATITVHIRNLRLKLETDSQNPQHILTVWGKGYKFE